MNKPKADAADAVSALAALSAVVAARDLSATMGLFAPTAMLLGSEAEESAYGADELRQFFEHLYERPIGFRWEWQRIEEQREGDLVVFVAEGDVAESTGGRESRTPYRFSGVVRDGQFALLHGSEPVPFKG